MLFIKLSLIVFNFFDFFYLFLNVFANIDARKEFIDEVLKILTKIATMYIFASLSIVLTKIKVRF